MEDTSKSFGLARSGTYHDSASLKGRQTLMRHISTSILEGLARQYVPFLPYPESLAYISLLFDSTGRARAGMSLSLIEKVCNLLKQSPCKPSWALILDASRLIFSELSESDRRKFLDSLETDGICYTAASYGSPEVLSARSKKKEPEN